MTASPGSSPSERPIVDAALFGVLAFLTPWGTGMLIVLSTHANLVNGAQQVKHPIPLPFPLAITSVMIGRFGPFLAAVAVTDFRSGRAGVRELFSQFGRWRVHPVWFMTAVLGPAFLGLLALCVTSLMGGPTPAHWFTLPRPVLFCWMVRWPLGRGVGLARIRTTDFAKASACPWRQPGCRHNVVSLALLAGGYTRRGLPHGTRTSAISHVVAV